MGTPYLWAHRTGADPRKGTNLYQMTSGHHLKSSRLHDFRTSTSAGDNEHHNHLSLSGLYCSFQQGFAVISPLGTERQLWVPQRCGELNLPWGSSFHLHGQPSACPSKRGSTPGDWVLVPCGRVCCTGSPKQRLINECLHSTSKV